MLAANRPEGLSAILRPFNSLPSFSSLMSPVTFSLFRFLTTRFTHLFSSTVNKRWRAFRAWMSYRPPWTPAVVPTRLDANETPITEPLSFFSKELPEQIGFFILRDVRGWPDKRIADFALRVQKNEAAWPHAHNRRVSRCWV